MSQLLSVSIWELLGVMSAVGAVFLGALWAVFAFQIRRYDNALADRFRSHQLAEDTRYGQLSDAIRSRFDEIEQARFEGQRHWQELLNKHVDDGRRREEVINRLERDFLKFAGELPLYYVRKEDDVRSKTVLESKLDALNAKIDRYLERRGDTQ